MSKLTVLVAGSHVEKTVIYSVGLQDSLVLQEPEPGTKITEKLKSVIAKRKCNKIYDNS